MKKIACMISILILSIVLGAVAIIGVFCLPTDKMFAHSRETVEFFRSGETPRWSKPLAHTTLDNSTDAVMMSKALYPVENPVFSAMILPSWSYDIKQPDGKVLIWYPARVMADVLEKNETPPHSSGELQVYPRYWHGYLTILKPMLLLAKFEYLRVINLYAQFLLTIFALILLYKKTWSLLYLYILACDTYNESRDFRFGFSTYKHIRCNSFDRNNPAFVQ